MRVMFALAIVLLMASSVVGAAEGKKDLIEGEGFGYTLEASMIAALCNISHFVKTDSRKIGAPESTRYGMNALPKKIYTRDSTLALGDVRVECHVADTEYPLAGENDALRSMTYQNSVELMHKECSLRLVTSQTFVSIDNTGKFSRFPVTAPYQYQYADVTPIGKPKCPLHWLDKEIKNHGVITVTREIVVEENEPTILTRLTYRK